LLQQQGFAAATGTGLPMAAQLSATAVVLSLHLMAVQGNNPHAAPVWHCRGLLPTTTCYACSTSKHASEACGCCSHLKPFFFQFNGGFQPDLKNSA